MCVSVLSVFKPLTNLFPFYPQLNMLVHAPHDLLNPSPFLQSTPTTNTTHQVVRYTALLGGVFYGIFHRRTLQAQKNEHQRHEAVHAREELITRAKEAYKQSLSAPKDARECFPSTLASLQREPGRLYCAFHRLFAFYWRKMASFKIYGALRAGRLIHLCVYSCNGSGRPEVRPRKAHREVGERLAIDNEALPPRYLVFASPSICAIPSDLETFSYV